MVSSFRSSATSTIELFYIILHYDYAPSPCGRLSLPQTTTGSCPPNSQVISYLLETSVLKNLIIFFWGSLVPLNLSFNYSNLASVFNP